jgi:hypothetical protein
MRVTAARLDGSHIELQLRRRLTLRLSMDQFDGCQRYDGALQIHAILLRVILPRTADRIKGSPSFITRYFALGWPLPRGIH